MEQSPWDICARFRYNNVMRAVLRTTDPVVLGYAAHLLSQEGIESVVFDTHASVMDGSLGFLPRRLWKAAIEDAPVQSSPASSKELRG